MRLIWVSWILLSGLGLGCGSAKPESTAEEGSFGTDGDADPGVQIVAPLDGAHLYVDTKTRFEGIVSDVPDDPVDLEAYWRSDIDGRLDVEASPDGEGAVLGFGFLTEGDHALTLSAVDTSGHVTTESIVVQVGPPNSAPFCAILFPVDGDGGTPGDMLTLTAEVSDSDVAADTLQVSWSSDLDGELGAPTPSTDGTVVLPINTLGVGTHTITLTVTDEVGEGCLDQVVYGVGEGPVVSIESPVDGAIVAEGESVRFSGTAIDRTGPEADLELSWTSSRDGVLFSGRPDSDGSTLLDLSDLSAGIHSIVLRATSSLDLTGTAIVSIQVDGRPSQPEVIIAPRPATSADDLVAVITTPAVDPEGEDIVYSYTWYRDGLLYSGSSSATVDASETARDEEWRVVLTPSDGLMEGTAGEAVTVVENSPPVVDSVAISPLSPLTGDDLLCTLSTSDVDSDTTSVTYSWEVNGVTVAATGGTLGAEWTAKGDTISCTGTGHDGSDFSDPLTSGAVIIGNTAPSIGGVRILPETLLAGDTPSCSYDGYSDVDGDADASTLQWTVNGGIAGTSAVLISPFRKGDVVSCIVTPFDGLDTGGTESASITVENSAPSIESVEMRPWPAHAVDTISCTGWGYSDADADPDDSYVVWSVNGGITAIGGALSGMFSGGDVVTCAMTPYDGEDEGVPISVTQTILNSAPTITGVHISPSDPEVGDVLTCESVGYSDIDGDTEASTYVWLVNDFEVGVTTPTLSSSFSGGDAVTCLLTVSDGESTGSTLSGTVTIDNHTPVITDLSVGPFPVLTDSVLYAEVAATDGDGDPLSASYIWSVNGIVVGETGESLDGSTWFDRDDEISLTVTVSDGGSSSDPATEGPFTVDNTAPEQPVVQISPVEPLEAEDDLVCEVVVDSIDADGDPVDYMFVWTLDDEIFEDVSTVDLSGDSIASLYTEAGQEWACIVTPSDGTDEGVAGTGTAEVIPALGLSEDEPALSCKDLLEVRPGALNGVYWIEPVLGDSFEAYCDMESDGGGWTRVATAPASAGAPAGWDGADAIDRAACLAADGWCRMSTDTIRAILSVGTETDDRFRLVAPELPLHTRYFWDTGTAWDPASSGESSSWWSVALARGGAHSSGCWPAEASGLGHEPEGCSAGFGHSESHRVYWYRPDLGTVGADSSSSFGWYAR